MPIGRGNPFDEIEDLFDRITSELEGETWGRTSSVPVDVADTGDEFVLTVDLPGFKKDEIDVTIADTTVRIDAERETGTAVETDTYLRRERKRGTVTRSVRLPEPVDDEGVEASYASGVLTVTLPKLGGDGGTRIEIE